MKKAKWVKNQNRKTIEIICPVCGKKFLKALSEYKRSEKKNKKHYCSLSCSGKCANTGREIIIPESFKDHWEGSTADDCTPFRYYLKTAKQRKHKVDIDCGYLSNLWIKQKGLCALTGLNITLKTHTTTSRDLGLTTASLDRIDSSKGYIKGNVQFVCVGINLLKGQRTNEEVKEFLKLLTKR